MEMCSQHLDSHKPVAALNQLRSSLDINISGKYNISWKSRDNLKLWYG